MQTVADRFFEAFDALLAMGETKIQTFCREGGIDKRNFYKKRDNTDIMYAGVNFPRENMYRKRPDRLAGASRFASARLSIKQRL